MATCTRTVWKVLTGCQRLSLPACTGAASRTLPVRTFAAVKAQKKKADAEKEAKTEDKKEAKTEKKVIDNTGRHKPFGRTAWKPVDDVYILRFYPRTAHAAADAIDMLKKFQALDFTPVSQPVYIDLKLDMKLEKKKKIDPFVGTVELPHPFNTEANKILVFTEDVNQAKLARENGAVFAGGVELIQPILNDEISADFYVAVPDIIPKLVPLKNKLRKKFPKSKRGSVGINIPKMLQLFKTGHEYLVEDDCYIRTQIAMLDMPNDHIISNLQTILLDVCSHRPAASGPFIERAIMTSQTSEAVWFNGNDVLPKPDEDLED